MAVWLTRSGKYCEHDKNQAKGYTVYNSDKGRDGGIDLLAAPGNLGFGEPRICVQVKTFINEFLEHYDKMPEDIRTDVPLKRAWVVVE
ncbi:MAG: restriction endonuclease [Verrucomicrobia bacterium]|nr:restriction endonuclease [Verrucomicrobiota bacterium]MCH8528005.1 restriction endonuclease [Kiritimatiellia bacterium]